MNPTARALWLTIAAVSLVAAVAAALGIGVRGTFGAHVAVDETQYVLSALSLAEDRSLDIGDELAEERWSAFADVRPPVQIEARDDGRQISPHDPLLPVILAVPMGVGGWIAAKAMLATLAGATAGLTLWLAVRRFSVPLRLAAAGVGLAAVSAPLAMYGQQVYPELPAALAVVIAVTALTGSRDRAHLLLLGVAITAMPWLSVKYVPVAAVLALLGMVRWWRAGRRSDAAILAGGMSVMAAVYLAVHYAVWGGLTAYASGDHFQSTGEFSAVGVTPDYLGRSLRLVALLVDREFGLAAWQPAWLLTVPAVAFFLIRRPPDTWVLLAPLAAGWLVATFLALTMHGFWWPGRQVVVVLPLAVLVILRWLATTGRTIRLAGLGLGVLGAITYVWLLADGYARDITWVSGFAETGAVTYRVLRPLLPDYRDDYLVGHIIWAAILLLASLVSAVHAGRAGTAESSLTMASPWVSTPRSGSARAPRPADSRTVPEGDRDRSR